jgi:hypothetical protein
MTELDPKILWRDQAVEATPISLEDIKRRARWSVRIIALRNGADYFAFIACGIVLLHGAVYMFDEPIFRVASIISVVALAAGAYLMWKHASAMALPDDAGAADYLEFQRSQLSRQLAAIRLSWLWYLGPVFVVMPVFSIAFMIAYPDKGPKAAAIYLAGTIVGVILTLAINAVRARRLRRMLKDLDRLS